MNYTDLVARGRARHGSRFSEAGLASQFIPYLQSGARIEVTRTYTNGETFTRRGRVSVTTGWAPVFLLMHTTRATGSWDTLGTDDKVVRVIPDRTRRR